MVFFLICLLICLSVADTWTTLKILAGGGRELNPVLYFLMRTFGRVPALIGMNASVIGAVLCATIHVDAGIVTIGLLAVNAITFAVVANNLRVLWRMYG